VATTPYYNNAAGVGAAVVTVPVRHYLKEVSCLAGPLGCTCQIGAAGAVVTVPPGAGFSPWETRREAQEQGIIVVTFGGNVTSWFVAWGA